MSFRFHPRVDALEAREVPAAFSFQLPDGTIGSGQFSTPDGVDPAQASQTFNLSDLSVTKNNAVYAVQPGATATYANGVLVGVNAVATGPDTINLTTGSAQVGSYSAPVAYDGAATRDTFQFSDGTVGAFSYTIPWGSVDATQASQSLTPTAFNLNIAGQNFASESASYAQQPALVFSYGTFVGVSFSLAPPAGFAYTSISDTTASNIITVIKAGTGQQYTAAPVPKQLVEFDFANASTGNAYVIKLTFSDGKNKDIAILDVDVNLTDTAGDIASKVAAAINGTGKFSASVNGTDVKIAALQGGRGWEKLNYSTFIMVGGNQVAFPSLAGPTLQHRDIVTVTGQFQQPNP